MLCCLIRKGKNLIKVISLNRLNAFFKLRRSYYDLFTLLKKALEHPSRNLRLSAEWLMSDFEHNIRTSWEAIYPDVKAKGCHFHFAKVSLYTCIFFFYLVSNSMFDNQPTTSNEAVSPSRLLHYSTLCYIWFDLTIFRSLTVKSSEFHKRRTIRLAAHTCRADVCKFCCKHRSLGLLTFLFRKCRPFIDMTKNCGNRSV